jgi:hypothetical protein
MISRLLAAACCVLLAATPGLAQSKGAKGTDKQDAITGTWTGELSVPSRQLPITLELKLDSKNVVTGTLAGLPNPGDVKKGTFDPKKGTLKLELGRSDGAVVQLVLDGTVTKDTASGRVTGEAGDGEFKLTRKK